MSEKGTAMPTEAPLTGLFDQAVQTFGETLKAGVKVQEQIAGYWSDALGKNCPAGDFQKKARTFFTDAVPAAQKNAEELLRLLEQNYKRSVDLLKKAFEPGSVATAGDMQAKVHALWEESVNLVKENAQAMAQANVKVMEVWADYFRQNGVAVPGVPKSVAR